MQFFQRILQHTLWRRINSKTDILFEICVDFLKKLSNKTYTIPKKSKSKKGQLPSYLDEDDDGDDFILDGSKFVKKPKEQKQDFIR